MSNKENNYIEKRIKTIEYNFYKKNFERNIDLHKVMQKQLNKVYLKLLSANLRTCFLFNSLIRYNKKYKNKKKIEINLYFSVINNLYNFTEIMTCYLEEFYDYKNQKLNLKK